MFVPEYCYAIVEILKQTNKKADEKHKMSSVYIYMSLNE